MADILVYVAIIVAIIIRLVLIKGTFVLPTFYRNGNEFTFNLGSIATIIIGIISALSLMAASPEMFSNWYIAGITAYTAPQIIDSIITYGARQTGSVEDDTIE